MRQIILTAQNSARDVSEDILTCPSLATSLNWFPLRVLCASAVKYSA